MELIEKSLTWHEQCDGVENGHELRLFRKEEHAVMPPREIS